MTSSSIKILAKSLLILYLQELGFLAPRAGFSRTLTPRVGLFLAVVESEYIPSKWISSFRLRPSFLMWGSYRHFFYEVPATLRQFSLSVHSMEILAAW